MRGCWVLLLPCFLVGCIVPPAVTLASLVVNGTSYVTTGKSVADHGISAVANEDCATWRMITGEDICQEHEPDGPPPTETAVATTLEPDVGASNVGSKPRKIAATGETGSVSSAMLATNRSPTPFNLQPLPNALNTVPAAGTTQPRLPAPTVNGVGPDRRYVVLGSFASRANANGVTRRHVRYGAVTMVVKIKGRRYHRVVAGPFAEAEVAEVRRSLMAAGIAKPWTIKGCKDGARPTPTCISVWQAEIVQQPIHDSAAVPTAIN